ncbi:putative disease resistance protein RGA4 [Salvia miltiorrhiza]|uniref:putative disease resistance protein RGA4 n=1 Tax=Salvia miltiorrhiza TaxID=226208 RepID=UPI0025AD224F|nr:putative disease resistance protein RGA4 [Salvia miltiorrhiza]XP_057781564.1 putative disease resistance protein RGA4 [Salvia miltiorrhiza]
MEGDAVAAVLQVLVQNLIDHSKNEIALIRGLDKEAAKLAERLDALQQYLNDAEAGNITGNAVKNWLSRLENVAFDADNVLDELNYHHLSKDIKHNKPMKEKVLSFFSSFNSVVRPRNMAFRIQEINVSLDSLDNEAARLGLMKRPASGEPTLDDTVNFETDAFTSIPIFIGREVVMSEIVEMLATSIKTDQRPISILTIVGMGGLGKTTLTRKVFDHMKTEKRLFGSHIWVHVSQKFDLITLLKKILKELTTEVAETKQDILKKIQEALKDKTYLLVLDDVWNDRLPVWEDFINSLSGVTSMKGNAIVVTTRNMEVASIVNSLHTHELKGLSDYDCWSIIKAKRLEDVEAASELETIGKKIATKCQGSPLAANIVGGLLRDKSEEEWVSIEENWLSRDQADSITKILRLSFNNLSSPSLKKCFAYLSLIPKGYAIMKQQVIEFWMAEGFLQADGSNEMESVGDKFINILLQSSLLQVCGRDELGNVDTCIIHDLVHDLASSILDSSNNTNSSSRVRYMLVDDDRWREESRRVNIPKEKARHLRTLLFAGEVSSNMFSDFECLHVLCLKGFVMKELSSSIKKLIHLRHLDISDTKIQYLPDWIGELLHLLTLRAFISELKKLPSTIKYLMKLRHVCIDFNTDLPAEIGKLTSLQTLNSFRVSDDKNGCKIEELGSLNSLTGNLFIWNLEMVRDKEEAERAKLCQKSKLSDLSLEWTKGEINHENVLEGLQPHSNLKKLSIVGYNAKRFPLWTLKMAVRYGPQGSWIGLNKLISVELSACQECEDIPMLGHLPNLKSLQLQVLINVKSINSSFYGIEKETRIVFPALEKLKFFDMRKLTEWAEAEFEGTIEVKVFPNLRLLDIFHCDQLMGTPTHLSSSCLMDLSIIRCSCTVLASIFWIELTMLTRIFLEEIDDLVCLPDWLFYSNPNLSELNIKKCPNLRDLPGGLSTLKSLEKLIIWNCPNLERIGDIGKEQSPSQLQGSLRHFEIYECQSLVYFPFEIIGYALEELQLETLDSLGNLPSVIDSLVKSPRLTKLTILRVPNFMATCRVETWPFRSLQELHVDASKGGSGSMETVDGFLQACCNSLIHTLTLCGMESWECLPESMKHLSTCTSLALINFGMEELPEWFGNFSSLRSLSLYNCNRLRRLPSFMPRLFRLEQLTIEGCPELRFQQQVDAADPAWRRSISRIGDITVDGSKYNPVIPQESRTRKQLCLGCL